MDWYLECSDCAERVSPEHPSFEAAPVRQGDPDPLRAFHHVIIGDRVPPGAVDDEPGALSLADCLRSGEREAAAAHPREGIDADDCGAHALHHLHDRFAGSGDLAGRRPSALARA